MLSLDKLVTYRHFVYFPWQVVSKFKQLLLYSPFHNRSLDSFYYILDALLFMKVQWLFDANFISWSEYVVMSLDIVFLGIMHSMGCYFGQTLYII